MSKTIAIGLCCFSGNDDRREGDAGTGRGHTAPGVLAEGGQPNDEEDSFCVNGCQVEAEYGWGVCVFARACVDIRGVLDA